MSPAPRRPRKGTKAYNVDLVKRVFEDLYNQGYYTQVEKIEPFVASTFEDRGPNSPRVGRGVRAFAACNEILSAIPGERPTWKIDEIIAADNKVVVRWHAKKSEHTSSGISIYEVNEKGELARAFTEWNALAIQKSAGFLPEGVGDKADPDPEVTGLDEDSGPEPHGPPP